MSGLFEDAHEFLAATKPNAPLIGLDLGEKTIGMAVSDVFWSIATPRDTIRRKKFGLDATALEAMIDLVSANGLILGLPRNMDGSEGPRCQSTRAFARNFLARRALPILLWDERLSTVAAERALLLADMSRAKRADVIDHVAAGYILQGALDRFAHIKGTQ
jgi:putative Holliday junction resolvase